MIQFKLPEEIAAKITGTGAKRRIKIIQSKLDKTESVILIYDVAYLVKFDMVEKKMDLYETIDLLFVDLYHNGLGSVKGTKLYNKIIDFQIIDKRIMAGVVYIADLRGDKVQLLDLFYKQSTNLSLHQ